MIAERRAAYGGYRTRELFVEGAGPTLVLVHGFGHPAPCWRPVLERCERAGQAAVAVDLPGFGLADPLRPGPVLPQLVRYLEAVVTVWGAVTPVVLVGNSLGASTSVRLLDTAPGLPVRGLLALDMAGAHWTPLVRMAFAGKARPLAGLAGLPLPRLLRGSAESIAAWLLYGDPRSADPGMTRLLIDPILCRSARRALVSVGRRVQPEVAVLAQVRQITCPTIVVHGARDPLVPAAVSQNLHASVPGSRFVLLDGIGHCPHLDAPDQIVALAMELASTANDSHPETA